MKPRYLADKSALARASAPAVAAWLEPRILDGEVARCSVIDLELLFSARGHQDFVAIRADQESGFVLVEATQADFDRAVEIMEALARIGHHRSVSIPDLLIAAVAERAGLVLVHYDADFDIIAGVSGQATQWVVAKGSELAPLPQSLAAGDSGGRGSAARDIGDLPIEPDDWRSS